MNSGDQISREALKDTIENTAWYHISEQGNLALGAHDETDGLYKAGDILIALEDAPAIEPPRWIPASEPPQKWEDEETKVMIDYLVYSPEYGVFMAHYCEPAQRWLIDGESVRVTYWQQPPEPPKEET